MWISDDAYQAAFYAGSWVRCCCHAGLLRLDGYWLETTEYLAACFADPVAVEDMWPLRNLVMAEAYEACTLGGDRRREWAVERLRKLGITDDGLERVRLLLKLYARPVAASLAAWDGAAR
jgi:hypothetical protein